ncbi:MAG: DUF1501 domain-containing protein [Bacteroidetes bacterium]|nr:DUF1501 domain-containing protein [Bacteroidota bacterium]
MIINRREFLTTSALASASLLLPNFLKALSFSENTLVAQQNILIILQLSGGNDGLNTIIPIKNDLYYKNRQKIGIKNALNLTDDVGIHPALQFFKELYDNGELAILNNVGYPEPDKSHFRSMDIWQTASKSNEYLSTGWVGRYLDEVCYNCNHPTQALEINDMLSLAMKGEEKKAFAFQNPKRLYQTSQEVFFKEILQANNKDQHEHKTTSYLYQTLGETVNNASYIFDKSKTKETTISYPNSQIAKDFKTIASLIKSDINTRVYYLDIGSFDTHVNQNDRQQNLFSDMNEAIKSFVQDMKSNGLFSNVMIATFSEFGRRVAENQSNGTDHGTANQMFFVSGGLHKKGLLNPLPNLEKLNDGDLIYTEDFRKVYATLLKNWLQADSSKILGWKNGIYDFI